MDEMIGPLPKDEVAREFLQQFSLPQIQAMKSERKALTERLCLSYCLEQAKKLI
jgi:hypothetical protein